MVVLEDLMVDELTELVQYEDVRWAKRICIIVSEAFFVNLKIGEWCCWAGSRESCDEDMVKSSEDPVMITMQVRNHGLGYQIQPLI